MCMNPELRDELTEHLKSLEVAQQKEYNQSGYSALVQRLQDEQRDVKRLIAEIPHKFNVGDGAHTSNNGDSYPYRVINVKGKSLEVVRLDYKPAAPNLPYGHEDWIVVDDVPEGTPPSGVYTLRKNGKWILKGCTMNAYWMELHPGAYFSRNPHV